jgi:predicted metal-dependent HD superfamily phosphohydrolase
MADELTYRFFKLWNELNAKNPEHEYKLLKEYYSIPKRYYHTLQGHIQEMLFEFDNVRHLADNSLAVELAIFYHDSICNPLREDNEEKSAELLMPLEARAGISSQTIKDAYRLVLATKHNRENTSYGYLPLSIDEQIIIDCDLASLGRSPLEFEENNLNVLREYSNVPKELYNKKRIEILEQFLDKKTIYNTAFFKDRYERFARINLMNTINDLEKDIYAK